MPVLPLSSVGSERVSLLHRAWKKYKRDGIGGLANGGWTHLSLYVRDRLVPYIPSLTETLYGKPCSVMIELSNHCNLNCEMCYRGKRPEGFMDFALFKKVVDDVAEIGNVNVYLHFSGEPLLHPNFEKMLDYISAKRSRLYNVGFFTNGMLLDESKAEAIVRNRVDWVTVSIDGVGAVQERIRRGSVYRVVEENLNRLLSMRGNGKPLVYVNTTISSQTDEELGMVRKVWAGKVDGVVFSPSVDSESFRLLNIERWQQFDRKRKSERFCKMPFYQLIVYWNGRVGFCCHDFNGYGTVGSLRTFSLMEIWRDKPMVSLRRHMLSGKFEQGELCGKCCKLI